ncbi:MAG TPA: TonB-dependent receptor [Gemmatimonadaceae bacterium]|nr:TonB-dependent receptor [Gemmatimonadaceae bacterium]
MFRTSVRGRLAAVLALHLLLVPALARAQEEAVTRGDSLQSTGIVEGRVTALDSRAPLADVIVRVEGTPHAALTGADGHFRITSVPVGAQVVLAHTLGRDDARESVVIVGGGTVRVDLALRELAAVVTPVIVSATREMQSQQTSTVTVDVLDGAELRRTRAAHPSGVLNRAAGVHVSELSGEGHSLAMRSPISTKPLFLYLEDGIPTRATGFFNHNALYEVNLPQSGGVEIMKGPGTALYGSDAIGGVVNVLTRPAPAAPSAEITLEGGAYGYTRALLTGGLTKGSHGLRADLNITRSDNWKEQAPFARESGTVRWDAVSSGWTLRSVVSATSVRQQDVPALNPAQFHDDPTLNRAPIAYRTSNALRASVAMETERGATLWSLTPFARSNRMELLPSWQLTYAPQTWDTQSHSLGVLAKVRRDFAPAQTRLVAGVDMDWTPGSFLAHRIDVTAVGADQRYDSYVEAEAQYDYDVTYASASPYVHVETSPTDRLRLDLGLRGDFIAYDYETHLAPLATGAFRRPADAVVRYAHVSPKAGVVYEITPDLAAYGSLRHGFRAPSQGQLFQQSSAANTLDLEPVGVDSREIGLRGNIGARLRFQVAAYSMTLTNDILTFVTASNTREASNAGRTRHRGVELGVTSFLPHDLRIDASYASSSQRYVHWVPQAAQPASGGNPAVSAVDYSGNLVEAAPRDLANVLLTWSPAVLKGGRLAAEWSHTGAYAMDPTNIATYGGHAVVHLHANVMVRSDLEVFARMTNVGDRAYAELAAYDVFRHGQFTPGAPRTLYAGVRWGFYGSQGGTK